MFADSLEDLEELMNLAIEVSSEHEVSVNIEKIKLMVIS